MKACCGCKILRAHEEYYKDTRYSDGYHPRCKPCGAEYKGRNREALNAAARLRHAERMQLDPEYAAKKKANRQKQIAKSDYVEKSRLANIKSYQRHRDLRLAKNRLWRLDNDRTEYMRKWSSLNRDKRKAASDRWRSRKSGGEVFTRQDIWDRDAGICGLCGQPADRDDWHLDHKFPLSRGGFHTMGNVHVSHPVCNLRKGAKVVEKWVVQA